MGGREEEASLRLIFSRKVRILNLAATYYTERSDDDDDDSDLSALIF